MKIEYIVLTVQKWELTDEKTGKVKDGISIHYIDPASKFEQPEKVGAKLIKTTADIKFFGKFGELPGIYEFEWGLESVSIGKDQKIVLQDVEFVKPVDLTDLMNTNQTSTYDFSELHKTMIDKMCGALIHEIQQGTYKDKIRQGQSLSKDESSEVIKQLLNKVDEFKNGSRPLAQVEAARQGFNTANNNEYNNSKSKSPAKA